MFYVLSQHIYDLNLSFRLTFRNFSLEKLLRLGKNQINLAFRSNFRNFARAFCAIQYCNIIFFMNFTLLITVLLTAVTLVVAAYVIAKLIGPRSYAKVKGEPYESGIPTRGSSWLPMSIGFYLFAILFLIFDVETVFLYPWAVVVKEFGPTALLSIGFFMVVLVLGLAYAWRKGDLEWK